MIIKPTDDYGKATLFNQFFHSVFTPSKISLPPDADILDPSVKRHLVSITISEADVFNALSPNKATGIDGIGPKVLKHCAVTLFKPLLFIFT